MILARGFLRWLFCLAGFAGVLCCTRAALAQTGQTFNQGEAVRYKVVFEGVEDKTLLKLLRRVSTTVELAGKPVASVFLLRGRVRADGPKLLAALKSQGRFAAKVSTFLDETGSPVVVHFKVSSDQPFLLEKVDVEISNESAPMGFALPEAYDLGLSVGGPALSKDIVSAASKLLQTFMDHGHPFPVLAKQRVVADFSAKTVHVTFVVNPGPYALFGPTRFSGLTNVSQSFLESFIPWREGEEYKQEQVTLLRQKLLNLGLFASVAVAPEKELNNQGRAAISVSVTERKMRTIKAGINYKTDEGPGANASWEHRNLFGQGEKLRLNLSASAIDKVFEANFEKPGFQSPKQQLLASFKATDEDTQAYHGQNVTAQIGLGRALTDTIKADAAVGYRVSRIQNDAANPLENDKRWGLVFIPLELTLNTRDDPLDPKKGGFLGIKAAPYLDTLGRDLSFVKAEIDGTHYLKVLDSPSLILALRASLGSISGAQAKDIPPDVRFYAGGSATVRGYAYQSVGPLRGTKPLGGGSLFDFGSELRLQVTELIGVVAFLDGGNVFKKQYPALNEGLLLGSGLGLRITTPIGPIRLDVAAPLDRRPKVDNQLQFYVSLGQAF